MGCRSAGPEGRLISEEADGAAFCLSVMRGAVKGKDLTPISLLV
jgi:hypothetical protein